jgi:hypothetical protein
MSDKRRAKRKGLLYYLEVHDRTTNSLFGRLVNISSHGMMVFSEKPIENNATFQLRLIVPEEVGGKPMDFAGRSVWCCKDVNPAYYVCGMQILDVTEKEIETIINLIIEYGLPD